MFPPSVVALQGIIVTPFLSRQRDRNMTQRAPGFMAGAVVSEARARARRLEGRVVEANLVAEETDDVSKAGQARVGAIRDSADGHPSRGGTPGRLSEGRAGPRCDATVAGYKLVDSRRVWAARARSAKAANARQQGKAIYRPLPDSLFLGQRSAKFCGNERGNEQCGKRVYGCLFLSLPCWPFAPHKPLPCS